MNQERNKKSKSNDKSKLEAHCHGMKNDNGHSHARDDNRVATKLYLI